MPWKPFLCIRVAFARKRHVPLTYDQSEGMKIFANTILFLAVSAELLAAGPLQNASVNPISLAGKDMVFDSTRNVLYLSVPSAAGFPYGNSIVTIDPATGGIIHSTFVGSEADKLAISSDGSRVYVGVDGANSFCWWEPATDTVSPLVYFTLRFGFGPFIATDFAIQPNNPHIVIASKDDVSSSAEGDIEVFQDSSSLQDMNFVYGAESICFSDNQNLIGFNNGDTGYDLWKWAFDGTHLTQTQHVNSVIAGFTVRIKSVDGVIFADNGKVVAATNLAPLGTFSAVPTLPAVEPIPGTNTVYFLGSTDYGSGSLQLASFDRKTFLKVDTKTFTNTVAYSMRSLVAAGRDSSGGDRLAFIQFNGQAGIITIPTPPVLKIESFQSNGSASQLTWSSQLGRQYQVQWSTDLQNWTTFITTTATQPHTTQSFGSMGTTDREFYRVVGN
jgi:hypothetical protein